MDCAADGLANGTADTDTSITAATNKPEGEIEVWMMLPTEVVIRLGDPTMLSSKIPSGTSALGRRVSVPSLMFLRDTDRPSVKSKIFS